MPAIRFRLTIPILIVLMLSAGLHSAGAASPSQGTPAPGPADAGPNANINLTLIASGLTRPVYVTAAPRERDRIFIVEKRGRIRIYKNGSLLPTSFLDVSTLVSYGNEQGLLSVAFHPNYANNGYFYVYYTCLLYTSPSPRDRTRSRMPSSA